MCVQIKNDGTLTWHENQFHCAVCCKVNTVESRSIVFAGDGENKR